MFGRECKYISKHRIKLVSHALNEHKTMIKQGNSRALKNLMYSNSAELRGTVRSSVSLKIASTIVGSSWKGLY